MSEPAVASHPPPESEPDAPSTYRLVIRVKMTRDEAPQAPASRRTNRGALVAVLVIVGAALSWLGVSRVRNEAAPKPAAQRVATRSVEPERAPLAIEPARAQSTTPSSPINQVIPDVPSHARETIHGTVRVSVRMIVNQDGKVLSVTANDPGPGRYFTRLAVDASKKWAFARTDSEQRRIVLAKFDFTRTTTTANVTSVQY